MSRLTQSIVCVSVFVALLVSSAMPAHAVEVKENPLFMKEFAVFVKGTLDREKEIRSRLDGLVVANKIKVREDFGLHPELVPDIMKAAGLERLLCATGRNYDELVDKLNREEAALFYQTSQQLTYWALMMAVEEAAKLSILRPSPPMSYRPQDQVPWFMALKMKKAIEPYLGLKINPQSTGGLSFDSLLCD
jgi:hypothetical protein